MFNQEDVRRFYRYFRTSLADTARLAPNAKKLNEDYTSTLAEFRRGVLSSELARNILKSLKSDHGKKEVRTAAEILVLPIVLKREISDGLMRGTSSLPDYIIPVCVRATLLKTGELRPDQQGSHPVLTRDLLEPNENFVTIGSVVAADQFYQHHPEKLENWEAVVAYAEELVKGVCGQALRPFAVEGYEILESVYLIPDTTVPAIHVINLYDRLTDGAIPTPLVEKLLTGCSEQPLHSLKEQIRAHRSHLGQMNSRHGLSLSQRETMAHFLSSPSEGHFITAVNGPPGTGKTTLLQSVVATLWVKAAIERGPCPVIVAASANNQPVTNIIDSFAKVEDTGLYQRRWLDGLESYGMYMPSEEASSRDERNQSRHIYHKPREHFMSKTEETEEKWKSAAVFFLEAFNKACPQRKTPISHAFEELVRNVQTAQEHLHQLMSEHLPYFNVLEVFLTLIEQELVQEPILEAHEQVLAMLGERVNKLVQQTSDQEIKANTANKALSEWKSYIIRESFWLNLFSFIPPIRRFRMRRDEAILTQIRLAHPNIFSREIQTREEMETFGKQRISEWNEALRFSQNALQQARTRYNSYQEKLSTLKTWCQQNQCETSLEGINTVLDRNVRYTLFKLATHYWEAAYLIEVAERLASGQTDNLAPEKLKLLFRRLAKLTPCFVSTFYMLPRHFTGSMDLIWQPLTNFIDLLIVDEAGQVLPDLSMASFALAQRALVVGDVEQISPVWNLTTALDRSNALRAGLLSDPSQYPKSIREKGFASASGSLMRVAQNACAFTKFSEVSRGLFLSEHRRCVPEIIEYCNVLIYKNKLQPKRESKADRILPALGYAHIGGFDQIVNGSRKNQAEAYVIAQWLKKNQNRIREHYKGAHLEEILAIVTPFAAQKECIRKELTASLGSHKITVGTVHALQGAEREIVIFSPTYGEDHKGGTFFDRDETMLNVAVSRAKDSFLIFGNSGLFDQQSLRPSRLLGEYLFASPDNEIVDIEPVWPERGPESKKSLPIDTLEGHRQTLIQAFQKATHRVIIVSPYITLAALRADRIPEVVREAAQKGITTLIVTDPRLNMPRQGEFTQCIEQLLSAGAQVVQSKKGVHSKELCRDENLYVCGSFNWLSAVRSEDSTYHRQEASLGCFPPDAERLIRRVLNRIEELK